MCVISILCFASLRHHLLDTHDAETFQDHLRIDQDWTFFFSPDKTQASGRPFAEAVKYAAYLIWGNDPAAFHLLVVATHTLASLLLASLCWRMGCDLKVGLAGGLLFLVNVAHFQAVHHISAWDYPLALVCGLLSLHCYLRVLATPSLAWWGGFYGFLMLGLMSHLSIGVVVPFALYWRWLQGDDVKTILRSLLPLGGVLVVVLVLLLSFTSRETSTWHSMALYVDQDLGVVLWGMGRVLLWFVSRLFTTAHWLPLSVYEQQDWELYVGGGMLVVLLWLIWKQVFPGLVGSVWVLLSLLPFLLLTETTIKGLPAGPSRYLYLATAGSSFLWAWLLQQVGRRMRAWGRYVFAGGLVLLLLSSYHALKKAEAISFYTSGRSYTSSGDAETGIRQLQHALAQSRETIPLEDAYFRLASTLPYMGTDPTPLLQEALELFPDSFWLNITMAVIQLESADPKIREHGRRRFEKTWERAVRTRRDKVFFLNVSAVYHNLGKGYLRKEDPLWAIHAFQQALVFKPEKERTVRALSNAHTLMGIQLGKQQRVKEAISAYRQALELNPANTTARINLGWLLFLQRRWDEAIVQYQKVLEQESSSHAHFYLGLCYLVRGDIAAAEAVYTQAIEEFGPEEGIAIGVVQDLHSLIKRNIQVETARKILHTYWPTGPG